MGFKDILFFTIFMVAITLMFSSYEFLSTMPVYSDSFYVMEYSSIILERRDIPFGVESYLNCPATFLFEVIMSMITGLNIVLSQKILNFIIVIVANIVIYVLIRKWCLYAQIFIVLFSIILYFTLYVNLFIYTPSFHGLLLFILGVYVLWRFYFCDSTIAELIAHLILSLSIAITNAVASLNFVVTCLIAFLSSYKARQNVIRAFMFFAPMVIVLSWYIYVAPFYISIGKGIIEALTKMFITEETRSLVYRPYLFLSPLEAILSLTHRLLIVLFTSISFTYLLKRVYVKKGSSGFNLFLLVLALAIANIPLFLSGLAIERILYYSGIFLIINLCEFFSSFKLNYQSIKVKILLLSVICLLSISFLVPNHRSNLNNVSHVYEVVLASYLGEKASLNGLFYFDLHLAQIFRFTLATLYGSSYPTYFNNTSIIHDRFAYTCEYLTKILLSRNVTISMTERSMNRWYYFCGSPIFSILNLNRFNIIYNGEHFRIFM
jgi:hypothetical protein